MIDRYWLPTLIVATITFGIIALGSRASRTTRLLLIYTELVCIASYHYWRLFISIPDESGFGRIFAFGIYGLEVLLLNSRIRRRMAMKAPPKDRAREVETAPNSFADAHVDIFIPTYNEAPHLVRKTILLARRVSHEHVRVWVLDDGRREEMRKLAESLSVRYVARPTNEAAKAGNLQYAFRQLRSEGLQSDFIVVLDADFLVHPEFLKRTLPLMSDAKVGCVQTPQSFYNPDPFQFAFGAQGFWPDDQRPWFDYELPVLDAVGGAFCCGTSFLIRVTALEEIGGFPTEAISEDMLTTMKLSASGHKTVYLNERLSMGLAPEGVREFMVQRGRWALGSLQVLLGDWGPVRRKRGFAKLLAVVGCFGWSLWSLYQLLWVVASILYWWFDVRVIHVEGADIMLHVVPLLVVRVGFSWLSDWCWIPFAQSASQLLAAPAVLRGGWQGIWNRHSHRFRVTAKGTSRDRVTFQWPWIGWLAAFAVLLAGGMLHGITSGTEFGWMGFFSTSQLAVVLAALVACVEKPKYRVDERVSCHEPVDVIVEGRRTTGTLHNLSEGGARISVPIPLKVKQVLIELSGVETLTGEVVRVAPDGSVGLALMSTVDPTGALENKVYQLRDAFLAKRRWSGVRCFGAFLRRIYW